jgi:hypothetical protein
VEISLPATQSLRWCFLGWNVCKDCVKSEGSAPESLSPTLPKIWSSVLHCHRHSLVSFPTTSGYFQKSATNLSCEHLREESTDIPYDWKVWVPNRLNSLRDQGKRLFMWKWVLFGWNSKCVELSYDSDEDRDMKKGVASVIPSSLRSSEIHRSLLSPRRTYVTFVPRLFWLRYHRAAAAFNASNATSLVFLCGGRDNLADQTVSWLFLSHCQMFSLKSTWIWYHKTSFLVARDFRH